jgi:hypothetical protein
VLLGATGVEDRLQDSVPEVVRDIMLAGIRVGCFFAFVLALFFLFSFFFFQRFG